MNFLFVSFMDEISMALFGRDKSDLIKIVEGMYKEFHIIIVLQKRNQIKLLIEFKYVRIHV